MHHRTASHRTPTYRVAADAGGKLWTNNNGTWIEQTYLGPNQPFSATAVSADGSVIVAGTAPGPLFISVDGGSTWTRDSSAGSQEWTGISLADDGTVGVATTHNGNAYTFAPAGTRAPSSAPTPAPTVPVGPGQGSLSPITPLGVGNWSASAVSASGAQMLVAPASGELQVSTNQGSSFTAASGTGGAQSWVGVAQSSNGSLVCALTTDGQVFVSTNGGASFINTTAGVPAGVTGWTALGAAADDFSVLVAGATDGKLYRSTDGVRTYVLWFVCACMQRAWMCRR